MAFVVERNIHSRAGRGQGSPLLWKRTLPGATVRLFRTFCLATSPSDPPAHAPGLAEACSQSHPCSSLGNAFEGLNRPVHLEVQSPLRLLIKTAPLSPQNTILGAVTFFSLMKEVLINELQTLKGL